VVPLTGVGRPVVPDRPVWEGRIVVGPAVVGVWLVTVGATVGLTVGATVGATVGTPDPGVEVTAFRLAAPVPDVPVPDVPVLWAPLAFVPVLAGTVGLAVTVLVPTGRLLVAVRVPGALPVLDGPVPDGLEPDGLEPDGLEPDGLEPDGAVPVVVGVWLPGTPEVVAPL
jgi:hypothetical protein